jgi:pimeloyl-ACP methyl ester carboxylesterase
MNNIDGYIFSKRFFEESGKAALPAALPAHIEKAAVFSIPEREAGESAPEERLAAAWRAAGADCEFVPIDGDNAFWINNRIFTSTTPGFFAEMAERMKALPPARSRPAPARAASASDSFSAGGIVERAVDVHSASGYDLCAVLYLPARTTGGDGFVFTHGGLIGMNGAFRFNTRAARRLAAAGYPCVCCDTRGMGRSGGVMENQEQRVLFREICAGLFAPDVAAAAALLKRESGAGKAVLFGVCGGAITNILAHSRYDEIDASVLLSIPVMLPSLDYGRVRMSEGYARFYLGLYARKIFNPKAWLRFLTGRSEMKVIFKSVAVASKSALKRIAGRGRGESPGAGAVKAAGSPSAKAGAAPGGAVRVKSGLSVAVPGAGEDLQFNPAFLDAWRKIVVRGERLFFVFGEHDNFKWEFNTEFVEAMPDEYAAGRDFVRIDEIPHANHMYTLREWQDAIIDRCVEWVSGA